MENNEDIRHLLIEIRDAQREHLSEYKRVAQSVLEVQQRASGRQEQLARFARRLTLVIGTLAAILLALLVYLLVKWSPQIFGR